MTSCGSPLEVSQFYLAAVEVESDQLRGVGADH